GTDARFKVGSRNCDQYQAVKQHEKIDESQVP
ncbi:unnamed protein product, partial [Didymodactylos carnosus]